MNSLKLSKIHAKKFSWGLQYWLPDILMVICITFLLIYFWISNSPIQRKVTKEACSEVINIKINNLFDLHDVRAKNTNIENYKQSCGDVFKAVVEKYSTPYKIIGKTLESNGKVISLNGVLLKREVRKLSDNSDNKVFAVTINIDKGAIVPLVFGDKKDADKAFEVISMAMR